jgi:hypothetical protein
MMASDNAARKILTTLASGCAPPNSQQRELARSRDESARLTWFNALPNLCHAVCVTKQGVPEPTDAEFDAAADMFKLLADSTVTTAGHERSR